MLIKKNKTENLFQFRTTDYCVLVIRLIGIKIKQTAYINTYPLTPEHTHNPTHNLTYPLTQHERPILRLVEWLPDGNLRLVEWLPEKFLKKFTFSWVITRKISSKNVSRVASMRQALRRLTMWQALRRLKMLKLH